jgi:hypothetical protein
MVRFCKSRIACEQSHEWFDTAVLTEARRQLGLKSTVSPATPTGSVWRRCWPFRGCQGGIPVGQHEIAPPTSASAAREV